MKFEVGLCVAVKNQVSLRCAKPGLDETTVVYCSTPMPICISMNHKLCNQSSVMASVKKTDKTCP